MEVSMTNYLQIQGSKNFVVSDRVRAYIAKRIEKLNYFKSQITEISFHLDKEKNYINKVNVTLTLKKIGTMRFESTDEKMYNAIDKVVHKMDVKINREKGKFQEHDKQGQTHEDFVQFFNEHDTDTPEPTNIIDLSPKATALTDAFMQMKETNFEFFGFNMFDEDANEKPSPAFIRKIDNDIYYIIMKKDDTTYKICNLEIDADNASVGKELYEIPLTKKNLFEAQKSIYDSDHHFKLFVYANTDKPALLFKEGNGKWGMIS